MERAERLKQWLLDGGLIVATSALGTGVDFPGIVYILHVGRLWNMIDYARESGSAEWQQVQEVLDEVRDGCVMRWLIGTEEVEAGEWQKHTARDCMALYAHQS